MDRRQEILTTAGDLFRENGYHATSMRDIAKRLDIRGSSLYSHIESKEQVLWEIVNEAADAFLAQAESVDTSLAPEKRLEALIRGHLEVTVKELPNAAVFFHEWKFLSGDLREKIILRRDAYEAHFRKTIKAGKKASVFKVAKVKMASLYILSALNWSYQWFDPAGSFSLDALTKHYTELSLRSLGVKLKSKT